jgi:hypothetical protein
MRGIPPQRACEPAEHPQDARVHGTNDAAFQAAAVEYRCDYPAVSTIFRSTNPFVIGEPAILLPPLLMEELAIIDLAYADGESAAIRFDLQMAEVEARIGRPAHEKFSELGRAPWGAAGHLHRNREKPALGRKEDHEPDRRRPHLGALHEAGFFHVRPGLQAHHRG